MEAAVERETETVEKREEREAKVCGPAAATTGSRS